MAQPKAAAYRLVIALCPRVCDDTISAVTWARQLVGLHREYGRQRIATPVAVRAALKLYTEAGVANAKK